MFNTIRADYTALAFDPLTLLARDSEGGPDLPRDDETGRGRFRMTEAWHEPLRKRRAGA